MNQKVSKLKLFCLAVVVSAFLVVALLPVKTYSASTTTLSGYAQTDQFGRVNCCCPMKNDTCTCTIFQPPPPPPPPTGGGSN